MLRSARRLLIGLALCQWLVALPLSARAQQAPAEHAADLAEASHEGEEAGAGHGAAGGEHGGGDNPLQWATDLALWTLIVFLLLMAALWKWAWGPLRQALDDRERNIRAHLQRAEQARRDAEQLVAQHQKKLEEVQDEIRAILEEARRDGQHTAQEIVSKAQAEAEATRQRALRDVERARDQALQAIAEQSAAMITHAAGRVIRASLNESDHRRLIEEALAEFRPDSSN